MDICRIETALVIEQDIKTIKPLPYPATKSVEAPPLPLWKERIQYGPDIPIETPHSHMHVK